VASVGVPHDIPWPPPDAGDDSHIGRAAAGGRLRAGGAGVAGCGDGPAHARPGGRAGRCGGRVAGWCGVPVCGPEGDSCKVSR